MNNIDVLQRVRILSMKAWVSRRKTNKGLTTSADDLWQKIKDKYPKLTEAQREEIYQHSGT